MSTPVKLRLYCSICARNDFYMDRIRAVADGLGLDYTCLLYTSPSPRD